MLFEKLCRVGRTIPYCVTDHWLELEKWKHSHPMCSVDGKSWEGAYSKNLVEWILYRRIFAVSDTAYLMDIWWDWWEQCIRCLLDCSFVGQAIAVCIRPAAGCQKILFVSVKEKARFWQPERERWIFLFDVMDYRWHNLCYCWKNCRGASEKVSCPISQIMPDT